MIRTYSITDKSSRTFKAVQPFDLNINDGDKSRCAMSADTREHAEWYGQVWGWTGITPEQMVQMEDRSRDAQRLAAFAAAGATSRDPRWSW